MTFDEFVDRVQKRARFTSSVEAMQAVLAVFEALGQRLAAPASTQLAAWLPPEIGYFFQAGSTERPFSLTEFFERVGWREGRDVPEAVAHTRAVFSVLCTALAPGQLAALLTQFPHELLPLLECEEALTTRTSAPQPGLT